MTNPQKNLCYRQFIGLILNHRRGKWTICRSGSFVCRPAILC